MGRYRIVIHGIDVTSDIKGDIPSIVVRKGEIGAITDIGNIELLGDNSKDIWIVGGIYSFLGETAQGKPVKIYDWNQLIYEGKIREINISNAGRDASIVCYTKVSETIEKIIPGYFDDQYTLAELSQRLYETFGVTVDAVSYSNAKSKQLAMGLQARINILPNSNTSLASAQEWLAKVGFCRHYFVSNVAHLDFVDPTETHNPFTTLTNEDIIDISEFREIEKNVYNGYLVQTATGNAYQAGTNMVPSLNCDETQSFVFPGIGQGIAYGDRAILMSERSLHSLTIIVKKSSAQWMTLESTFKMESLTNRYGIEKTFEVLSIDNSSLISTVIQAVSV